MAFKGKGWYTDRLGQMEYSRVTKVAQDIDLVDGRGGGLDFTDAGKCASEVYELALEKGKLAELAAKLDEEFPD